MEATFAALAGAYALDFDYQDILATALALTREDFYKSMTSYSDHRSWQDVYHPQTIVGKIYLKLTIKDGVVIVSFKEF